MARIDHVSAAVVDLGVVERRLRERYGLGVQRLGSSAGDHATWVAHVPLGSRQYVELHTPDAPGGLGERVGRWLADLGVDAAWYGWCAEVADIDERVAALGLDAPDVADTGRFGGDPARTFTPWSGRFAGTRRMAETRGFLPYLMEYDQAPDDLDRIFEAKVAAAAHDPGNDVGAIAAIELDGDAADLAAWLGAPPPPGVAISAERGNREGVVAVSVTIDGATRRLDLGAGAGAEPATPASG